MHPTPHIWLRAESKTDERRTHLTPERVKELVDKGFKVTVEKSKQRIFEDKEYAWRVGKVAENPQLMSEIYVKEKDNHGCAVHCSTGVEMVSEGAWTSAPQDAIICGLKELPESSEPITNQHIYFAHAYKNQTGWAELLHRFVEGHGSILDVEFMTDEKGCRVVAEFAPMAGLAGMAIGVITWCAQQLMPESPIPALKPFASEQELVDHIKGQLQKVAELKGVPDYNPRVIVVGALGRCGRNAVEMAERLGIPGENIARWDLEETKGGGPFAHILDFDIFINCIFLSQKIPPFITMDLLDSDSRTLTVVVDVSCDCSSPNNPLPIYNEITSFQSPARRVGLRSSSKPLDVVAIDHLPSLLPRESSIKFADKMAPYLLELDQALTHPVWAGAHKVFREKAAEAEKTLGPSEQ